MAGALAYKTDCYIDRAAISGTNTTQALFKAMYDFFQQLVTLHATWTLHALNFGDITTYTNGLGTDYYDGTLPFGEGAFAVFKAAATATRPRDLYHFIAWGYGSGDADHPPNNPCKLYGSTGTNAGHLMYQCACAVDSGDVNADPWGGGTAAAGADAKADPVWVLPASGKLWVLPRSNGVGGTYATQKDNCIGMSITTVSDYRYHMVGDEDNFIAVFRLDGGNNHRWIAQGSYIPLTGYTPLCPVFMVGGTSTLLDVSYAMSSFPGSSSSRDGGSCLKDGSVDGLQWGHLNSFISDDVNNQPNIELDAGPAHGSYKVAVGVFEGAHLGYMDDSFWRCVGNRGAYSTNVGKTRIVVEQASVAALSAKFEIPWDGSTDEGVGLTREGNIS